MLTIKKQIYTGSGIFLQTRFYFSGNFSLSRFAIKFQSLFSIIVIGIFHCAVIGHLPREGVGSVGVVDVDLGRLPDLPPLALHQADGEGDHKRKEKNTCYDDVNDYKNNYKKNK